VVRIGIIGHSNLTEAAAELVAGELREILGEQREHLVGVTMPFSESNRDAYMAASEHVLSVVDKVVAVWEGGPSGGHGGTVDVVVAARDRGLEVTIVWPERAARL
jgi:hypothetical protein